MKPTRFDHIHFTVTDLEAAIKFYEALGFTLLRRLDHGGESAQMTAEGGMIVDLYKAGATSNPGYNHFAVAVEGLDEVVETLKGSGVEVDGPVNAATGRRLATVRDPDGFLVQIVEE